MQINKKVLLIVSLVVVSLFLINGKFDLMAIFSERNTFSWESYKYETEVSSDVYVFVPPLTSTPMSFSAEVPYIDIDCAGGNATFFSTTPLTYGTGTETINIGGSSYTKAVPTGGGERQTKIVTCNTAKVKKCCHVVAHFNDQKKDMKEGDVWEINPYLSFTLSNLAIKYDGDGLDHPNSFKSIWEVFVDVDKGFNNEFDSYSRLLQFGEKNELVLSVNNKITPLSGTISTDISEKLFPSGLSGQDEPKMFKLGVNKYTVDIPSGQIEKLGIESNVKICFSNNVCLSNDNASVADLKISPITEQQENITLITRDKKTSFVGELFDTTFGGLVVLASILFIIYYVFIEYGPDKGIFRRK